MTFDRIIDAATFTTADVTIFDPVGRSVSATSVSTADNQTFTIDFASQSLPGRYTVNVGPDIKDTDGNQMNQNGDGVNDQAADAFTGYFWRESPVAATVPFAEGFEVADVDALNNYWSFTTNGGVIDVTTQDSPVHGGAAHLRMKNTSNGYSQREAILKMDLSANAGANDLFLDFWVMRLPTFDEVSTNAQLQLSGDGTNWVPVTGTIRPSASGLYLQYVYDLDAQLAAAGIGLDSDVYLKIWQQSYYSGHGLTIDDVRVGTADPFGPRITGQSPSGTTAGPVSAIDRHLRQSN